MSSNSSNRTAFLAMGVAGLVIVVILVFFGDRENPLQESQERLDGLEQAIRAYVEIHKKAPESLLELKLPSEGLQDHLGEPFNYMVTNATVVLTSYGSDKKPGGVLFKRDHQRVIKLPSTE